MKRTLLLSILLLGGPAFAATMGAEATNQDACGNPYLPNTVSNAAAWGSLMSAFGGHNFVYFFSGTNYWPEDLVDSSVPGGNDSHYGDSVNLLFLSSHGNSDSVKFRITSGITQTIDGVSTCRAWTVNPNNNTTTWWKLGDGQLRILSMVSCHSLQLTDLSHWDRVAQGIHMIAGGDGDMYDISGRGANYAFYGTVFGMSVKQAWFAAHDWGDETAVVMAYGVNSSDAVNRRENEHFNWSMARLGPKTYRAWAWIH